MRFILTTLGILFLLGGCAPKPDNSFLVRSAKEHTEKADLLFKEGEYTESVEEYKFAIRDLQTVIKHMEDSENKKGLILDTMKLSNKVELARIGAIIK
jgi:hypothetical protein